MDEINNKEEKNNFNKEPKPNQRTIINEEDDEELDHSYDTDKNKILERKNYDKRVNENHTNHDEDDIEEDNYIDMNQLENFEGDENEFIDFNDLNEYDSENSQDEELEDNIQIIEEINNKKKDNDEDKFKSTENIEEKENNLIYASEKINKEIGNFYI